MQCTRCQPCDDGLESTDDGKYAAQSTISNGDSDEETSDDIGGFAKNAGCLQKLKRSEKQVWLFMYVVGHNNGFQTEKSFHTYKTFF